MAVIDEGGLMSEIEIFKECFYSGRLLWIRGPAGTRKVRITYELLKKCGVLDAQVAQLDLHSFLKLFERGIPRKLLSRYRVLMVRGVDRGSNRSRERLVHVLGSYRVLQFELGVRVILISNENPEMTDSGQNKGIFSYKPMVLNVSAVGDPESDLDARVHSLLEEACRLVGKRIYRISEKGAQLLENTSLEGADEALFSHLVRAVQKSKGSTLTEQDLCF